MYVLKVFLKPLVYSVFMMFVSDRNILLKLNFFCNDLIVQVLLSALYGISVFFYSKKKSSYKFFLFFSSVAIILFMIKSLICLCYNSNGNPFVLLPILLNFSKFCHLIIFEWGKVFVIIFFTSYIANYLCFLFIQLYKKISHTTTYKKYRIKFLYILSIIIFVGLSSVAYNKLIANKNIKKLNKQYYALSEIFDKLKNRKNACLIEPEKYLKDYIQLANDALLVEYLDPKNKIQRIKFISEVIEFYEKIIKKNKNLITPEIKIFYYELIKFYEFKEITKIKAKKLLYSIYNQLCYLYEKTPDINLMNFMISSPIHYEFFYVENDLEKLIQIYQSKLNIDKKIENLEKKDILKACSLDIYRLANCYVKLKRYNEAKKLYNDLWQYFDQIKIDSQIRTNYKINLLCSKLSILFDFLSKDKIDQISKDIVILLKLSSKNKSNFDKYRDLTIYYSKLANLFYGKKKWEKAEKYFILGLELYKGMNIKKFNAKKISKRDFIDYFSSVEYFYGDYKNPLNDSEIFIELDFLYSIAIYEQSYETAQYYIKNKNWKDAENSYLEVLDFFENTTYEWIKDNNYTDQFKYAYEKTQEFYMLKDNPLNIDDNAILSELYKVYQKIINKS